MQPPRAEASRSTAYPLARSDSASWNSWNIGPELGVHGDGKTLGNRMPNDQASVEHFLGALLSRQSIFERGRATLIHRCYRED